MHTRFDNFWRHNNNRLNPVFNLPKNDNCSQTLLPDSYKHVQSGGCPSLLNSVLPPQSIASVSHENDWFRKSYDQSMWQSSVYSHPFTSSQASNLHPQETILDQTSNFVYSSPNYQPQDKPDFRYLGILNGNVNIPPVYNTNTIEQGGSAHTQDSENINAHIPRIRVKDVFSLNNVSLVESGNPSLQYEITATDQAQFNDEPFLCCSGSVCQQNIQSPCNGVDLLARKKAELENCRTSTPGSLLKHLLSHENTAQAEIQNHQRNTNSALSGLEGVHIKSKANLRGQNETNHSNAGYSDARERNERSDTECSDQRNVSLVYHNLQENLPTTDLTNLTGNPKCDISGNCAPPPAPKSSPSAVVNNHKNCLVKITVPQTGACSFISRSYCSSTDKNSSLQSSPEQNDQHCNLNRKSPVPNCVNDEKYRVALPSLIRQSKHLPTEREFICGSGEVYSEMGFAKPENDTHKFTSYNKSKTVASSETDSEDCVHQVGVLKGEMVPMPENKTVSERKDAPNPKGSYKSNINIAKLNMLIKFLKKGESSRGSFSEGKERQSSCDTATSKLEVDSTQNRRKLSKTHIVRNKNKSREMISLLSPKGLNCVIKPQVTESGKNVDETEEIKSGCPKGGLISGQSVDFLKKPVKCITPGPEQKKKSNSSLLEDSNKSESFSKSSEPSENPSSKGKTDENDEYPATNKLKAFQDLKTQFCTSCNLVSTIDSFWINVVSGELRCLNCFMRIKADEDALNTKTCNFGASTAKRKGKTDKGKTKEETFISKDQGNAKDENGSKRNSKCKGSLREKINDLKENLKQEELSQVFGSIKCNSSGGNLEIVTLGIPRGQGSLGEGLDSQKEKPSEEQKLSKSEKSESHSSSKQEIPERTFSEPENQEMKDVKDRGKGKQKEIPSAIKPAPGSFSQVTCTKGQYQRQCAKKETMNTTERPISRSIAKGEKSRRIVETQKEKRTETLSNAQSSENRKAVRKERTIEERAHKEQGRHREEESVGKRLPKEGCVASRDHAAKEISKKTKQEPSDKSRVNVGREGREKPKAIKQFVSKERKAVTAERKSSSGQNGLERLVESSEQSRKRKNTERDVGNHKVQIMKDLTKREIARCREISERRVSKEIKTGKSSPGDTPRRSKLLDCKNRTDKVKSSLSKEISEGHVRKEAKPRLDPREKARKFLAAATQKGKTSESEKVTMGDFVNLSRRKSVDCTPEKPSRGSGDIWKRATHFSERKLPDEVVDAPRAPELLKSCGKGERKRSEKMEENSETVRTPPYDGKTPKKQNIEICGSKLGAIPAV